MSTPYGKFRKLTPGEVCLAMMIFGDSIDYARVKVYHNKFAGLQRDNVAMTPFGNIHYPRGLFWEDFAVRRVNISDAQFIDDLQLFIHEMVHVWQYQRGHAVWRDGIRTSRDQSNYHYELGEGRRLPDYNMEAQAQIIADYFLLLRFGDLGSENLSEDRYKNKPQEDLLPLYQEVLADFILNPHDSRHLPDRRRRTSQNRGERQQ